MYQNNSLDVKNKRVIIFGGLGILGSEFTKHLLSQGAKYVSQIYIKLDLLKILKLK